MAEYCHVALVPRRASPPGPALLDTAGGIAWRFWDMISMKKRLTTECSFKVQLLYILLVP